MSRRFAVLGFLTLAGVAAVVARAGGVQGPRPPGAEFRGQAFLLTKVQEGIYQAEGTGALSVGCNAAVIVNDEDVLVVDSLSTPAAAWALAEQIKTITDKPIRYVVNTHFHWDHVHGNQIYGSGVEIIGHAFTRRMVAAGESKRGRSYDMFVGVLPSQIAQLRKQVHAMAPGAAKEKLGEQLQVQEQYELASASVTPQPPTITLTESMT
ncbi:MAG: MBL fold metallo-hydrolase, partial [Acidobacteria bacterium]|nr:MBL fold metallo-hydrolase [Acidobacteriota bacterium]